MRQFAGYETLSDHCACAVSSICKPSLRGRAAAGEKSLTLQDTARRANRGQLGSGTGTVTLITSRGQVKTESGLDPIRVFGSTIKVSDLLPLLEARAQFNRSGVANPMSGVVTDLTYVVLYTLSLAKDPDSIPVIAELLKDKDHESSCGWSAIALYDARQIQ